LNRIERKKYVSSTTLDKVEWNNSILIDGDVAEQVERLRLTDVHHRRPHRDVRASGQARLRVVRSSNQPTRRSNAADDSPRVDARLPRLRR